MRNYLNIIIAYSIMMLLIILVGILSNFYLVFIYKKVQISERSSFIFLLIDIFFGW